MNAVPHPHYLGDINVALIFTIMYLTSGRTIFYHKTIADHNVVSTIAGVLEELQDESHG